MSELSLIVRLEINFITLIMNVRLNRLPIDSLDDELRMLVEENK